MCVLKVIGLHVIVFYRGSAIHALKHEHQEHHEHHEHHEQIRIIDVAATYYSSSSSSSLLSIRLVLPLAVLLI